jgi:hypothetical protein
VSDTQQIYEATPPRIAALLRARTKDNEGREVGLWTEATRPTLHQVEELIGVARGLISDTYGPPGERCQSSYEHTVAIQAAMLAEMSYWPEQVRSDRSPYQQLERLFERALEGYRSCIAGEVDSQWRPATVYSVRTPSLPPRPPGQPWIINVNDPYADDDWGPVPWR